MNTHMLWIALLLSHAAAEDPTPTAVESVQALTEKTFDEVIVPSQLWLVKFYAPWCGHCKRLAPILDDIVSGSKALGDAKIAKVDCTVEKSLCTRFDVHGFPTLLVMHEGQTWEHRGMRSRQSIDGLLARMQRPAVRELATRRDLTDALATASADGSALFFLGDVAGGGSESAVAVRESFLATARTLQHRDSFVSSSAPGVLKALSEQGHDIGHEEHDPFVPPFVARAEGGEAATMLELGDGEVMNASSVASFVEAGRLPLFNVATYTNFYELSNSGRPLVMLLLDPKTYGVSEIGLEVSERAGPAFDLRSLAREESMRSRFAFAMLDYVAHDEVISTTYFVSRESGPRLVVLRRSGGYRSFAVDAAGDAAGGVAGMRAFLESVADGSARFEYEGTWGMPARTWRKAKARVPALANLDFMPSFSISAMTVAFIACSLLYLIFFFPIPEDFENPPGPSGVSRHRLDEVLAAHRAKKNRQSQKVD